MRSLQMFVVSAYKYFGFVMLLGILAGLGSYLFLHAFFFLNHGWIAPTVVSPSDERVLQLSSQVVQQTTLHAKLLAERAELVGRLEDARRVASAEERYQKRFKAAASSDLSARLSELSRLEDLRREYTRTKEQVDKSNEVVAGLSREKVEALYQAKLVTKDALVNADQQLSQMAQARLSLNQDEVSLGNRIEALRREVAALQTAQQVGARQRVEGHGASYETLRLEQEFSRSLLDAARARDSQRVLEDNLQAIDKSLLQFDALVRHAKASPYLRALEGNLTVAFVPYANLGNLQAGSPVYGCRLGPVLCRQVGKVAEVLEGEVAIRHPLYNQQERGQMVQLELTETRWSKEQVLYAGRAPLFF